MSKEKSLEDKRKEAVADLASLSRVSHRLALVDTTDKLCAVLDKLLPRLLQRIGDNNNQVTQLQLGTGTDDPQLKGSLSKVHAKLVEMLSHTMKRVRDDKHCKLPCLGVLGLLLETETETEIGQDCSMNAKVADPFTVNLSLAFLTLGVPRCTSSELEEILPGLLVLNGYYSASVDVLHSASTKSQWYQLTHLLFRTMELMIQFEEEALKGKPSAMYSNKRLKATETQNPSNSTDNTETETETSDSMHKVRQVLKDPRNAGACYDLILDVLLYQTMAGNVPPPGLSQAGHERLKGGQSATARDWAAEMAPRSRLCIVKSRFLDWIAPSRRWSLFLSNDDDSRMGMGMGMTRTVALLIAAAGDPTTEVSQRAATYLKQHLDAQRDQEVFGDPVILVHELLISCVGANNAQLALSGTPTSLPSLGIQHSLSNENQQAVLSFRRRMISDSTFGIMATYVSKIFDEVPTFAAGKLTEMGNIGTLSVLACSKILSALRTSTGLTMLRGKQYVAAAQMLNALVVRISTMEETNNSDRIRTLLAKSLAVACSCLSAVSKTRLTTTGATGSEGNTSVRDALYGVICVLSRSNMPMEKMSWLFSAGKTSTETESVSIETATLLFGCISNEQETLRPRAVAALDALLAAYSRIHSADAKEAISQSDSGSDTANPWGQIATIPEPILRDQTELLFRQGQLAKALLPLLWTASQHSQPKQSRVAAARWSSDLITSIDLTSASQLLCFLAGDGDVTASSIAKAGLGLQTVPRGEEGKDAGTSMLADFAELTRVLFSESNATSASWRPSFWEFSPKGKAIAVRYLLKCLLHDLYGGDDDAIQSYLIAVTKALVEAANLGRGYMELLDECSEALSLCLSTSSYARALIFSNQTSLSLEDIEQLALTAISSRARRFLAESWGHIYKDNSLWQSGEWTIAVLRTMQSCAEVIELPSSIGHKHGAAFLGGTCVCVFRRHPRPATSGWDLACR
jgi:proteasome component ECM29